MWSHVLLCHCESVQVCPSKWESLSHDRNLAVITSILGWRTQIFCAKTVVFQGVLGEVVFGIFKLASILVALPAVWSCDGLPAKQPPWRTFHFKLEWSQADFFFATKLGKFQVLKSSVLPTSENPQRCNLWTQKVWAIFPVPTGKAESFHRNLALWPMADEGAHQPQSRKKWWKCRKASSW